MAFYKIENGKALVGNKSHGDDWIEYVAGNEPQELLDGLDYKTFDDRLCQWKDERALLVENIIVDYNGNQYQGDEISQGRLTRAYLKLSISPVGTTIPWTVVGGNVVMLDLTDIITILSEAGQQQTDLWNDGRPTE